jgi:hypothetical protein
MIGLLYCPIITFDFEDVGRVDEGNELLFSDRHTASIHKLHRWKFGEFE